MTTAFVGESWEDWDASGENWYGQTFQDCSITDAFFDECDCTDTNFITTKLTDVDFSLSYLVGAKFIECQINGGLFDKSKVRQLEFQKCNISDVDFFALDGASSLTFVGCKFKTCNFIGMLDVHQITFRDCVLDPYTKGSLAEDHLND